MSLKLSHRAHKQLLHQSSLHPPRTQVPAWAPGHPLRASAYSMLSRSQYHDFPPKAAALTPSVSSWRLLVTTQQMGALLLLVTLDAGSFWRRVPLQRLQSSGLPTPSSPAPRRTRRGHVSRSWADPTAGRSVCPASTDAIGQRQSRGPTEGPRAKGAARHKGLCWLGVWPAVVNSEVFSSFTLKGRANTR